MYYNVIFLSSVDNKIVQLQKEIAKVKMLNDDEICELKSKHREELIQLREEFTLKLETSKSELTSKEKDLEELSDRFIKSKENTISTENRLLEIVRERNELEKSLSELTKKSHQISETLSFQNEQLKVDHRKAIEEMVETWQEERKNHKKEKYEMQEQIDKACCGLKVNMIITFKCTVLVTYF